jgi:hypothetical protein
MKKNYKILSLTTILSALFSLSGIAQNAWINEIHYDDFGADTNEFIEVVLQQPENYTLSSFAIVLYNGNNGQSYDTKTLDQYSIGETVDIYTFYYFLYPLNGVQNGSPDGIALVYNDAVITGQFLSYEGAFAAVDGPASGMSSVDIGVAEAGELEGLSLQLSGEGNEYDAFTWQPPAAETIGQLNNGQALLHFGIGELIGANFNLYPNPNQGEFILENPFDEVAVLEVYSVFGLKINTIDLLPGENKVSLEIANGLYLVCITNRDGKILKTERMIIN